MMKHLDLFSGYGGFATSAKRHGLETIGFSEIDKYAIQVLNYHFPEVKNYGDITKIDFKQFNGEVDIITGGSPCQDLSVAGRQAGLSGARSGLFFEYVRAVKDAQPKYFIWENVKGALSSSNGWDFARVQIEMEQAGYSIQWCVLNAKDFGVLQNRERIFVIGTRNGSEREILPFRENSKQALRELTSGLSDASRVYDTNGVAKTLKGLGGGLGAKTGLYAVKASYRNGEPSFTLNTQDRHGIFNGFRIRRLTPIECERLMGLEDNWTSCGGIISDTQRYKLCGNGVVVNVVDYLFDLILK